MLAKAVQGELRRFMMRRPVEIRAVIVEMLADIKRLSRRGPILQQRIHRSRYPIARFVGIAGIEDPAHHHRIDFSQVDRIYLHAIGEYRFDIGWKLELEFPGIFDRRRYLS